MEAMIKLNLRAGLDEKTSSQVVQERPPAPKTKQQHKRIGHILADCGQEYKSTDQRGDGSRVWDQPQNVSLLVSEAFPLEIPF